MKKTKRMLATGLVLAMTLSACGAATPTSNSETTTAESTAEKEPIHLTLWGGVPAKSGSQDVVDAWNAEHPDVQVEFVYYQNDNTGIAKLDTALMSGEPIDMFFSYYAWNLDSRVQSGIVENLDDYGAKEFVEAELMGGLENCLQIDGSLYAIPTMYEPFGLMVNQSMLDEAGVTIPENWTLEEFEEINRALTRERNGKKVYGSSLYYTYLPLNVPQSLLGADYMYTADGTASNFDHPAFLETNSTLRDMMNEGIALSYDEIFSRTLNDSAHAAFLNEDVAMIPYTSWMLRNVKNLTDFPHDFVTTFVPYPTTSDGAENPYRGILNGFLSINSQSEHKEECWEFIKYWVTEGSVTMTEKGGKISAWNKVSTEDAIAMTLGPDRDKLFDVEAYKATAYNPDNKFLINQYCTAIEELTNMYKQESEKYFLNTMDDETYINTLKERGDEIIQKALK